VVVHGDAERPGHVDDGLGHLDVGARGRRIAGGMIVHQPTASSIVLRWLYFSALGARLGAVIEGGNCFRFLIIPFIVFLSR
jgi:hypothetical protein